jgi:hypothetical protein
MAELALAFSWSLLSGVLPAWAVAVRVHREHESLVDDRPRSTDRHRPQSLRVAGVRR